MLLYWVASLVRACSKQSRLRIVRGDLKAYIATEPDI